MTLSVAAPADTNLSNANGKNDCRDVGRPSSCDASQLTPFLYFSHILICTVFDLCVAS